jgi:hypothetical protein
MIVLRDAAVEFRSKAYRVAKLGNEMAMAVARSIHDRLHAGTLAQKLDGLRDRRMDSPDGAQASRQQVLP